MGTEGQGSRGMHEELFRKVAAIQANPGETRPSRQVLEQAIEEVAQGKKVSPDQARREIEKTEDAARFLRDVTGLDTQGLFERFDTFLDEYEAALSYDLSQLLNYDAYYEREGRGPEAVRKDVDVFLEVISRRLGNDTDVREIGSEMDSAQSSIENGFGIELYVLMEELKGKIALLRQRLESAEKS